MEEKKAKIKEVIIEAREMPYADLFTNFKRKYPEIIIMLREFTPIVREMIEKKEIEL